MERICLYAITQYVDIVTASLTLPPEDKKLLIRLYKCALVGIILDWLENGMEYDLLKAFERIRDLLGGSGQQAFLKSAASISGRHS